MSTELSAATNKKPYVIHTRMLFTDDRITTIQSAVTTTSDWAFNAAGDAYLDSWGDGTVKAPYGAPCARLEGGSYTAGKGLTTNTCKMPQFPQPFKITNRRYVIDEELEGWISLTTFRSLRKRNLMARLVRISLGLRER
ncbi:hypothetical protein BDZ45DRAFT_744382 [Acephala macrosclerotiorum]|nr:hypothetical protein BDZ45DRAFT_744382 [Acephala macrosclerotiorum]